MAEDETAPKDKTTLLGCNGGSMRRQMHHWRLWLHQSDNLFGLEGKRNTEAIEGDL